MGCSLGLLGYKKHGILPSAGQNPKIQSFWTFFFWISTVQSSKLAKVAKNEYIVPLGKNDKLKIWTSNQSMHRKK